MKTLFSTIFVLCLGPFTLRAGAAADTVDLGDGMSITLSAPGPINGAPAPVQGILVEWQAGMKVVSATPESAEVDGEILNGAMWRPMAGVPGYKLQSALEQGFDSRGVFSNDRSSYVPKLNVHPGLTGKPFEVPGPGTLILSRSAETVGNTWQKQKPRGPTETYRRVTFVDRLPPEGTFAPPVRGRTVPRAHWTKDRVDAQLDVVFPPTLDIYVGGFGSPSEAKQLEFVGLLEKTTSPAWATNDGFHPMHARDGTERYAGNPTGDATVSGDLSLALCSDTLSLENRRRIAYALVRRGIDIAGMIEDGGYWQSNGGITHGKLTFLLTAALLLDDPYMLRMALDPLHPGGINEEGKVLEIIPTYDQRSYRHVIAEPTAIGVAARPENDMNEVWGIVVGEGGYSQRKKNIPDGVPFGPETLGEPFSSLGTDRGLSRATQHFDTPYRAVKISSLLSWCIAMRHVEATGVDLSGISALLDCADQALWEFQAYLDQEFDRFDRTRLRPDSRFDPDGPASRNRRWTSVLQNSEKPLMRIRPPEDRVTRKPRWAFAPCLEQKGPAIQVKPFGLELNGGAPVTQRHLRWRIKGGEWTEVRDVEFPTMIEGAELTPGTVVEVQLQLQNRHGEGPWSVNTPNQIRGSGGAEKPQATIRLN